MEVRTLHSEQVVYHEEYRLTAEEVVVYAGHQCDGESKSSLAVVVDVFFHSNEHQREESSNVLEMVEENIVYLEAGECIQQCSGKSSLLSADESAYVDVCGEGGDTMFQRQKEGHRIRDGTPRKQYGQPEKRASCEIEGIRRQQVGTEVGVPVPAELTASYGIIYEAVERYLLSVIVAVVDESSFLAYHEGYEGDHHDSESKQKYKEVSVFGVF